MHYFAYGSNLDPVQMRRRCPGSSPLGRATLRQHRLVFPRTCESWAGGVAGIEPHETSNVEGVIYHLTAADLAALDEYEGLAEGDYVRRKVVVHQPAELSIEVWTYFANPAPAGPQRPSRHYLDAIVRGAEHYRLPESYIARLKAIRTVEDLAD
ncbi:gamma-glutamylcyclotransferase family protein [Phycisphaerales bacterium AB-hyl4]|uniref:Gamma-glutamylcyclotransferase family protein n=1 Tax=Natronomicrosphaera hydrolytica TaxID=3242702 RepID=A0ABV4U6L1_9BACT